jgi:hypothetical protein
MTDYELETLISRLEPDGHGVPAKGRAHDEWRRAVVAELKVRGHFDWNGVRYSAGADGTIKRGLPW